MTQFQSPPTELRFFLPETTFLEPYQIAQAQAFGRLTSPDGLQNELYQWQSYIQALALFGFSQWLGDRLIGTGLWFDPHQASLWQSHVMVQVGEFKLCLIAAEHVLDEMVHVPGMAIAALTAAHFYIFIEVIEEQAEVLLRGLLRYDQLKAAIEQRPVAESYHLPLAQVDPEPDHLLHYCRLMEPDAIALPEAVFAEAEVETPHVFEPTVKLTEWLQGIFVEGWQAIETMLDPNLGLAFNTRTPELGAARGKLIDIEMQIGTQTMALVVNITPENDRFGVLVQLHPTGRQRYLPTNLKLSLLSRTGKVLQEVQARSQDNYIQLRPFKGESDRGFSLEVSLGNVQLREDFVL
jgi:hypothetical protein